MRIICISGLIGSGKDTVAEYISEKYGYEIIDYANILREVCKREGLELTRENLQNLRVKYGNTFLAEEAIGRVKKSSSEKIILSSLRRSEDYEMPKKEFKNDLIMILIESAPKVRFGRLSNRGRENDPKDFKEFERQELREKEIFNFDKTFSYADFKIKNNDSIKELKHRIDEVMHVIDSD